MDDSESLDKYQKAIKAVDGLGFDSDIATSHNYDDFIIRKWQLMTKAQERISILEDVRDGDRVEIAHLRNALKRIDIEYKKCDAMIEPEQMTNMVLIARDALDSGEDLRHRPSYIDESAVTDWDRVRWALEEIESRHADNPFEDVDLYEYARGVIAEMHRLAHRALGWLANLSETPNSSYPPTLSPNLEGLSPKPEDGERTYAEDTPSRRLALKLGAIFYDGEPSPIVRAIKMIEQYQPMPAAPEGES